MVGSYGLTGRTDWDVALTDHMFSSFEQREHSHVSDFDETTVTRTIRLELTRDDFEQLREKLIALTGAKPVSEIGDPYVLKKVDGNEYE